MNEAANELSLIRKYLLGDLKGEEREQLEERALLDPDFKDRVLIVEENLIDEYAEGALQGEERQRFQMMFYSNPQRRLEVQVVEGLQQHAGASWWTKFLRAVQDKFSKSRGVRPASAATSANVAPRDSLPVFGKAAIAFALVVTVIIAFLIVQRLRRPEQTPPSLTQDQSRRDLIERELARLNSESQSLPATVATTLSPGLSRGDESQRSVEFPTVTLLHETESAQLKLLLRPPAHEYRSFQALLTPVGGRESYKVDLRRVDSSGAPELVLTIPAHALGDGDYRVQLSGRTADGRTETLSDHYYYFRLVRR